jgi:hypothetical protein
LKNHFKETNSKIRLLLIDLIRHIIVKSSFISKSILLRCFPFFIEIIIDYKVLEWLKKLFILISHEIKQIFVINELMKISILLTIPIIQIFSLDFIFRLLAMFGAEHLNIIYFSQKFSHFLEHKYQDIKEAFF